jgi:hypothetical protein
MADANRGQDNTQIRVVEEQVKQTEDAAKEGARAFGRRANSLGSAVEMWAEQAQHQHRALRKFVEGSMGSYMQLFNTPASYLSEQAENQQQQQLRQTFQQLAQQFVPQPQQQQQQFQQMSEQWVGSYMGFVDAQLDYAQYAARREQGLPPIKGYDELSVDEVTEHLDELSVEEIGEVKAYERRNKNRESLIKRMDQKINAASSS